MGSRVIPDRGIGRQGNHGGNDGRNICTPLRAELKNPFTPLSAYAFIVFVLLNMYMPCIVAAVAMVQEFGTWKWYGIAFGYQMVLAWGVAFMIYQGGKLLGLGG